MGLFRGRCCAITRLSGGNRNMTSKRFRLCSAVTMTGLTLSLMLSACGPQPAKDATAQSAAPSLSASATTSPTALATPTATPSAEVPSTEVPAPPAAPCRPACCPCRTACCACSACCACRAGPASSKNLHISRWAHLLLLPGFLVSQDAAGAGPGGASLAAR